MGLFGYIQTGSQISLMSGLGIGALMVLCGLAMFVKNKLGVYIAIILTLSLTAMFAYRYTVTEKPLPALFAVISGGMLLFLLAQAAKWKKVT